jgi:hypothetical protein
MLTLASHLQHQASLVALALECILPAGQPQRSSETLAEKESFFAFVDGLSSFLLSS